MLFKLRIGRIQPQYFMLTEVKRNAPWRQVSSGTRMVHQKRHMPSGKNKLELDLQIYKSKRKLDNGFYQIIMLLFPVYAVSYFQYN